MSAYQLVKSGPKGPLWLQDPPVLTGTQHPDGLANFIATERSPWSLGGSVTNTTEEKLLLQLPRMWADMRARGDTNTSRLNFPRTAPGRKVAFLPFQS